MGNQHKQRAMKGKRRGTTVHPSLLSPRSKACCGVCRAYESGGGGQPQTEVIAAGQPLKAEPAPGWPGAAAAASRPAPGRGFPCGRSCGTAPALAVPALTQRPPPLSALHSPRTPGARAPFQGGATSLPSSEHCAAALKARHPSHVPPSVPLCRCGATLPPVATPRL